MERLLSFGGGKIEKISLNVEKALDVKKDNRVAV